MLNIEEIKATINDLENGPTTFASCTKLASLYTVLDHFESKNSQKLSEINEKIDEISQKVEIHTENDTKFDKIIKEYNDILPSYETYKDVKTKYQLHQLSSELVLDSMKDLCKEIKELIQIIYSSSDMQEERVILNEMLENCSNFS